MGMLLMIPVVVFYSCQGFFNKLYSISYEGDSGNAAPVFAVCFGAIVALATWIYNGYAFTMHTPTVVIGLLNGVVLYLYNLCYVRASCTGPYAFQSLMAVLGSILLTTLFTVLYWHDTLSTKQIIGIIWMIAGILIFNAGSMKISGARKGYMLWVIGLFLANGAFGILMDMQQRVTGHTLRNEMIITSYVVSFMIPLALLVKGKGRKTLHAFSMPRKTALYMLASGVSSAIAVNLRMYALKYISTAVLYAVNNGGILIGTTLLGIIVLKEKVDRFKLMGMLAAIIGICLLSL